MLAKDRFAVLVDVRLYPLLRDLTCEANKRNASLNINRSNGGKKIRRLFVAVFILLVFGLHSTLYGYDLSPPDAGWEQKSDERDYKTYFREKKGSETGEVLMVGVIDGPPSKYFSVVGDYENFPQFMPYMQYVKLLRSEKVNENRTDNYVFFYFDTPIVSTRFYTLKLQDEKNYNGKPDTFRSYWTLEKQGPNRKTPLDPDIAPHVKGGSKAIETAFNEGYWLFEPIDGGKKTKVTYYVWTNPGGSIPDWIANKANTIALPKLMKAIKQRVKDPKYDTISNRSQILDFAL